MGQRRVSVVTGANAGIGREVTAGLMLEGHHVVMACRNMAKCQAAKADLDARNSAGQGTCACSELDLAVPESVHSFADRTKLGLQGQQLAVLVNNAGVMGASTDNPDKDVHIRINHLGPFLLTRLLLPAMGAGSRVVNIASRAHMQGSLSIGDGNIQGKPSFWYLQYARSKLCNVLFTAELQRRLRAQRSPVTAYSVSPGRVATTIYDGMPPWQRCIVKPLANWLFQSPKQGAATVLYACLAPELEGKSVLYLHDCKEATASATAQDADLARQLWEVSSRHVGLPDDLADV